MKIYIDIDVPDDWNDRLDMQWIVEGEVKADRWSWNRAIPSPVNAQLLEALKVMLRNYATVHDIGDLEMQPAIYQAHAAIAAAKEKP